MLKPKTIFSVRKGRYFASIRLENKTKFLGTFQSKEEAKKVVERALNGSKPKILLCYY